MCSGIFRAPPGGWRRQLLEPERPHPVTVTVNDLPAHGPGLVAAVAEQLASAVGRDGVAAVRLPEVWGSERFIELGHLLGVPTPETSPDVVGRFVEADVILDLVATHPASVGTALQPFSSAPLTMHSEGSGRPLADQPRRICLMCLEPGDASVAQTLVVRMQDVYDHLDDPTRKVLERTSYDHDDAPVLLRTVEGRPVFAFRDFGDEPLAWRSWAGVTEVEVQAALGRLVAALYARQPTVINWERALVALIDNRQVFHGRTAGTVDPRVTPRHLRRLRLGAED